MKFKAVMKDSECMREYYNVVHTLSKLTKECVISIENDRIHFVANEDLGMSAPLVWVDIETKLYFSEYHLEVPYATETKLMLSVSPANLTRALAMLKANARLCKLKLVNLQFPCLRVEVDVLTQRSEEIRQIVHDVPVNVIPCSDWNYYDLPQKPNSKLVINVPINRLIRGVIDKMKNISPTIIFYATSDGEMNLVVETEMTTITTRHRNLDIKELNPSKEERNKDQIEASCIVDCKKASMFFSALQVPSGELALGIDDNRLIHMEVIVRQGIAINCLLPAVCM